MKQSMLSLLRHAGLLPCFVPTAWGSVLIPNPPACLAGALGKC